MLLENVPIFYNLIVVIQFVFPDELLKKSTMWRCMKIVNKTSGANGMCCSLLRNEREKEGWKERMNLLEIAWTQDPTSKPKKNKFHFRPFKFENSKWLTSYSTSKFKNIFLLLLFADEYFKTNPFISLILTWVRVGIPLPTILLTSNKYFQDRLHFFKHHFTCYQQVNKIIELYST